MYNPRGGAAIWGSRLRAALKVLQAMPVFWLAILFPGAPHLRLRYVEHVRMSRLRIDALGRPVEAHLDGEPSLLTPLRVEPLGRVTLLGAL